ncbi:Helix-turn-helix domain [uncultured Clostridium sp.]|uniref:helix-turn-helix domain-containing protein n=1 Tax=uncultured Clostridium sp. TaxID=59620 RepID=UPI000820892F|nr:helix-turn-helix domain-containing protein [uncultured Clostridium sp.]SCJ71751.1 Helix-turn-helix domain [uncultured Clostridium sp.]
MEILSTGDKIRRARIYEGITLKELCGDKISISKMSCIENGKIKADEDTLRYIAEKLNINYDYLVQDIRGQIEENIRIIDKGNLSKEELYDLIKYILDYSVKYEYYDLAFIIIHKLFLIFKNNNNLELMQLIIAQYYEIYKKNEIRENTLIYYKDMATFFMAIKEYYEAINYYDKILTMLEEDNLSDSDEYIRASFNQGICYMEIGEIEKAYSLVENIINEIEYIEEIILKGLIYHIFACLSILSYRVNAEKYIKLSYEYLESDKRYLSKIKSRIGRHYYQVGNAEKGKKETLDAMKISCESENNAYIDVLIDCVETFYTYKEYELADEMIDKALNLSICSEDTGLIERAYYFKGMILQKQGLYRQAETYMNISTDYFLKSANDEDTYKRYNEMAELYYNIGEPREAIKYFTLAMNLEKN